MALFLTLALRTKDSSEDVVSTELKVREMVFGNNEKCMYVKDIQGVMHKFCPVDDNLESENRTWSSSKIVDTLEALPLEFDSNGDLQPIE